MRRRSFFAFLLVILIIAAGCGDHADASDGTEGLLTTQNDEEDQENEEDEEDPYTIKWGLLSVNPGDLTIYEETVNDLLETMGCEYKIDLTSVSISFDGDYLDYVDSYADTVRSGDYDIITTACSYSGCSVVRLLADEGLVEPLGEWLMTDGTGSAVYDSYPSQVWEILEYDDEIYGLVPNVLVSKYYVVLNVSLAEKYDIEINDVSTSDIPDLLAQAQASGMGDENDGFVFSTTISYYCTDEEYELTNGEFIMITEDDGSLSAGNILDDASVLSWIRTMNGLYKNGLISYDYETESIAAGDFFMISCSSYSEETAVENVRESYGISDDVELEAFELTEIGSRSLSAVTMTSVAACSTKAAAAMEVLGMIYSDEDLTRAIIYGKEGESYTVEDGEIVPADGYDPRVRKIYLGNSFLLESDETSYIMDLIGDSITYIGAYGLETGEYADDISDINIKIVEDYHKILYGISDDIESDLDKLQAELETMGIREILEYLNEQLS